MEAWKRRPQEQVVVLMDLNILDEAMADMEDDDQGYDPEKLRLDTERYKIMYEPSTGSGLEDEMEETYERALAAVKGDEELTEYVKAIRICNDLDDICEELGVDKKVVYNLNKRLLRRLHKARLV